LIIKKEPRSGHEALKNKSIIRMRFILNDHSITNELWKYGMILNTFPKLFGVLVNLREFSVNDAQDVACRMNYNISKYLYDVPNPYSPEDALNFINSAHSDFKSLTALHFAIEYRGKSEPRNNNNLVLVGSIGLKNIDLLNKKANLGYWIGEIIFSFLLQFTR
jgi:RimJ/RimL family protein N-acetyltransferase